jgi:hypothetical protein
MRAMLERPQWQLARARSASLGLPILAGREGVGGMRLAEVDSLRGELAFTRGSNPKARA